MRFAGTTVLTVMKNALCSSHHPQNVEIESHKITELLCHWKTDNYQKKYDMEFSVILRLEYFLTSKKFCVLENIYSCDRVLKICFNF